MPGVERMGLQTGAAPVVGTLFQRDGGIARAPMARMTPPIIRAPQRKA